MSSWTPRRLSLRPPIGLALATILVAAPFAGAQQLSNSTPRQQSAALAAGPLWPKTWSANEREPVGYAIAVTRPGMITVTVNASGAPVLVALYGAAPQPVAQQVNSGSIRFSYQVTPENVQAGILWRVRIAVTQSPGSATGSVAIDQPPADPQMVAAMLNQLNIARHQRIPRATVRAQTAPSALLQARRAQFEQSSAARQAALHDAVKSRLSLAPTMAPMANAPAGITTRSPPSQQPSAMARPTSILPHLPPPPSIASIVNGEGTQQVLSGDPLVITGSGFGQSSGGAGVEFLVLNAPGLASPYSIGLGPILAWSDSQIMVNVPSFDGFSGTLQLGIIVHPFARPATALALGFNLMPTMVLVEMPVPPTQGNSLVHNPDTTEIKYEDDSGTSSGSGVNTGTASGFVSTIPDGWHDWYGPWLVMENQGNFFGDKGDDDFFMQTVLAPGWSVQSAEADVHHVYAWLGFGGVELAGTDPQAQNYAYAYMVANGVPARPWIRVHTWENAFNEVTYAIHVVLIGPKNTNPFVHP